MTIRIETTAIKIARDAAAMNGVGGLDAVTNALAVCTLSDNETVRSLALSGATHAMAEITDLLRNLATNDRAEFGDRYEAARTLYSAIFVAMNEHNQARIDNAAERAGQ